MIYELTPVPKPRQTKSDKWKKRPCVVRYREYADRCRELGMTVENGDRIIFHIAMPPSWPKAKRAAMDGQPHRQRPDIDNLLKAVMDAVLPEDCSVWWVGSVKKFWSKAPAVIIDRAEP